MSALISAPDTAHFEKLFAEDLTCRVVYGTVACGNPAQWKIIMACCGGSDFLCAECFYDMSTKRPEISKMHQGRLLMPPMADTGYFGCSLCRKVHPTWAAAVKESIRI